MKRPITTAGRTGYTPEDLLAMPDGDFYELVDGELREKHVGEESSSIGGKVYRRLDEFLENHPLGVAFPPDRQFQCFPHAPGRLRKPDASFIRKERRPNGPKRRGHTRIPPDIAVEVVSPGERTIDTGDRIQDFLLAGTPLVWVVDPFLRTLAVHRQPGAAPRSSILHENDEVTGEDVLPGFAVRVGDLFPPVDLTPQEGEPDEPPAGGAGPGSEGGER